MRVTSSDPVPMSMRPLRTVLCSSARSKGAAGMGCSWLVSLHDDELPISATEGAGWADWVASLPGMRSSRSKQDAAPQSPRCVAQRLKVKRAGGLSADLIGEVPW